MNKAAQTPHEREGRKGRRRVRGIPDRKRSWRSSQAAWRRRRPDLLALAADLLAGEKRPACRKIRVDAGRGRMDKKVVRYVILCV